MSLQKHLVVIHLQSIIEGEGDKERHEITSEGELFHKDDMEVVSFKENSDDEGEVRHFITIYPDRVNINRAGQVTINQQFKLQKKTEAALKLPQGNIHMEIHTSNIEHTHMSTDEQGELKIDYEVTLNDQINRKHKLELTYYKEDAK